MLRSQVSQQARAHKEGLTRRMLSPDRYTNGAPTLETSAKTTMWQNPGAMMPIPALRDEVEAFYGDHRHQ
jgi:hypothetical protein